MEAAQLSARVHGVARDEPSRAAMEQAVDLVGKAERRRYLARKSGRCDIHLCAPLAYGRNAMDQASSQEKLRYGMRRISSVKLVTTGIVLCVLIACAAEAVFLFCSIFMMGSIPLYDDFATRDFSQWKGFSKQVCCNRSAVVVDAPNWDSKNAARFEINFDEPIVKGSHRSEFRSKATEFHRLYEYGLKIFVPPDWQSDNNQVVVTQMHNTPDYWKGEGGLVPPLELSLLNNTWVLRTA